MRQKLLGLLKQMSLTKGLDMCCVDHCATGHGTGQTNDSTQTYDKFESIPTTGKSHPDAGFIAQQVESVPELARFVITPPEDATPKRLNYSALFTHAVAAIQELDRLVQDQAARISALENQ